MPAVLVSLALRLRWDTGILSIDHPSPRQKADGSRLGRGPRAYAIAAPRLRRFQGCRPRTATSSWAGLGSETPLAIFGDAGLSMALSVGMMQQ